jgi:hypothetical protein
VAVVIPRAIVSGFVLTALVAAVAYGIYLAAAFVGRALGAW